MYRPFVFECKHQTLYLKITIINILSINAEVSLEIVSDEETLPL
jgi:hypothetical protein